MPKIDLTNLRSAVPITRFKGPYYFLSNFYTCRLKFNEREYKTVEHYYQAHKATNDKAHDFVRYAKDAREAKIRGHKIKCRKDWEAVKVTVMLEGLTLKFADDKLAARLLATGDCILSEGNTWHDNEWGNCECDMCKGTPGLDMLGGLLMGIRRRLKNAGIRLSNL